MSLKISSVNRISTKDNLFLIVDKVSDLKASGYLKSEQIRTIKKFLNKEKNHIVFSGDNRIFMVVVVSNKKDKYERLEETRQRSFEALNSLNNMKTDSVSMVNLSSKENLKAVIESLSLGNYQFIKYFKNRKEIANTLKSIRVVKGDFSTKELATLKATLEGTYIARDLINEPLSFLTATQLGKEISSLGRKAGFKVNVLNKKRIEALKMGGLLAVNLGSFDPPTFSIMEWKPRNAKNKKPIVLVGKGVVFDTGGVSLKPTKNSMDFMKSDMGGAATVVGTFYALAKSKLPLHVIGLVPATDNRPGNRAYVPGDVIKMHSGHTVEVLNTDAEGRMLLADALHYAKRYKPELVMDFATLTGAAAYAMGGQAISLMGNASQKVKDKVIQSGFLAHERLVEFPMWEEFGEMMKSDIADIKNVGAGGAGHITAGKFLEHFTDYPWLHFDIAGMAFKQTADSYRGKNGTGIGVRMMMEFLQKYN